MGVYVTLGGFFGVIITDIMQTVLIAIGAVILTYYVFSNHITVDLAAQPPGWNSLGLSWTLWDDFTTARACQPIITTTSSGRCCSTALVG